MRKAIKEQKQAQLQEERQERLSEIREYGNKLFEKWSRKRNLGEGMDKIMENDPDRARRLSLVLENQEKHLQSLTETQISSAFQTTPENVLRIVRLGYPNSVRGEIFTEFPMVTARDSIYYLSPVYTSSARGATADNITHESSSWRYASEIEEDSVGTGDDSTTTFTGPDSDNLNNPPLRPYTVIVMVDNKPVGRDDGSGNITGDAISSGSVDYDTGEFSVTFDEAPGDGEDVVVQYWFDSEEPDQYDDIKSVQLQLRDYQFRAKPYPLYVSWSKMTELLLGTTLDIDAEEALLTGAADELKKSLDFHAVRMGYRYARRADVVEFNADYNDAGSNNAYWHAQSLTRTLAQASKVIYNKLQRGGVNTLVAGTEVASYLTLHDKFDADGNQPEVGIYRIGTLMGKPVYQAPNDIVPSDEMIGVWKNPQESGDVCAAFGSLVPLYQTQTLEFRQAYSETGLFHFGDYRFLQPDYLVRVKFNNLDYT